MKRRIFLQSFAVSFFSILLLFAAGVGTAYFSNRAMVRERLVTETELAALLLTEREELAALDIFSGRKDCRATVISSEGDVLYDSDTQEILSNHMDREEVAAALRGEPQPVVRYSKTFGCQMTYYAVVTELSDGEEVVLRLAVRSAEVNDYILATFPFLVLALLLSALVTGIFAERLSTKVTRRVTDISACLHSVSNGTYVPLDPPTEDRELKAVYSEINEVNAKTVAIMHNERELARRKEEFFANASHELKTPLTTMLGLSELALSRETDTATRRSLERIHKESLRLSDLISDMLMLSRLETLRESDTFVSVDMAQITAEALTELSEAMAGKGVTATVTGTATVKADEKRMYELMQNLLSNAVNYNKDGGSITVTLEEGEDGVVITVKDTGIGIAEENIPHLCERFYRVDKSRSKKTGGTGLGLAIVKHVCALYGGEISIRSTPDVGTEVEVRLPR